MYKTSLAFLSVEVIDKHTPQRRYWNSVLIANKLLLIPDIPCHAGSMHERKLEKHSGRVILNILTVCKQEDFSITGLVYFSKEM